MEAELRRRLGVAIYGTGKETVAEVVGDLLRERGLKIGVVDTLTDGQIVREFEENGAGDVVVAHGDTDIGEQEDPRALTEAMAQMTAPEGGVGLAMVGPYEGGATFMAVYGSDPRAANNVLQVAAFRIRSTSADGW